MRNALKRYRHKFFQEIAAMVSKKDVQFVIITHILPDRPEVLSAIETISPIALVIAIPYSIEKPTYAALKNSYNIVSPSLEELTNKEYLLTCILNNIDVNKPVIILEIGGYTAQIIQELKAKLGTKLIGVIEDTETGHRQFERLSSLPCPVISVARSPLKETEDFLVGSSCLFSTERLIRSAGFLLECKRALILGFGKVGRGLAHALLRSGCQVCVYDTNPIRRILALSEGFQIPNKQAALQQSDLIFGATGNYSVGEDDFTYLKKGALLISCSSKKIEFDLECLNKHYQHEDIFENFTKFSPKNSNKVEHHFYLLAEGAPINFLDGAVIGPVLTLIQAEIIYAIKTICSLQENNGLFTITEEERKLLANKWLEYFCDDKSGNYQT